MIDRKIRELVTDIMNSDEDLNSWEEEFMYNMCEIVDSDGDLSPRQIEKIRSIHEKKVLGW